MTTIKEQHGHAHVEPEPEPEKGRGFVHVEHTEVVEATSNILPGFSIPAHATLEDRFMLMRYAVKGHPLKDATNMVLHVIGVYTHDDTKRDEHGQPITEIDEETGEQVLAGCKTTIFLVQQDGQETTYHTQSAPVYGWVKGTLRKFFGTGQEGDLLTVVPVIVRPKRSANGRTYHDLDFYVEKKK